MNLYFIPSFIENVMNLSISFHHAVTNAVNNLMGLTERNLIGLMVIIYSVMDFSRSSIFNFREKKKKRKDSFIVACTLSVNIIRVNVILDRQLLSSLLWVALWHLLSWILAGMVVSSSKQLISTLFAASWKAESKWTNFIKYVFFSYTS